VSGTVVDTSVWIDFFTGKPASALEDALASGSVILPLIVLSELVSGARSEGDRTELDRVLYNLPLVVTPRAHWLRVGELRAFLARRGIFPRPTHTSRSARST
jgi:predicted nucleic acid-binding protein